MTDFETYIDAILADPLAEARAAGRAIGIVGFDVPEELIEASGRFACHLPWSADRATPTADRWLEGSFPDWARSILEDWAAGRFDGFESVIFSRGEDSAQRLYYYVCELQRRGLIGGPEPLIFDIAKIGRETSVDRTGLAVRSLADRLGAGASALREGIAAVNRRRAIYAEVEAGRTDFGSLYERIARAGLFARIDGRLASASLPKAAAAGRVLLAGTAPPDDRLHRVVDALGWAVTGDANERSLTRLGPPIDDDADDPAMAIARQVHGSVLGPRSFADRGDWIVAEAARARADAVILWLVEEEEALVWHVPAQRRALAAAGIPTLVMTRRRWDAADGAARDIGAFIEGLGR